MRVVAGVLLFALITQSSGAAAFAASSNTSPFGFDIAALLATVGRSFGASSTLSRVPHIHHTPLPRRAPYNYHDPRRYAHFLERRGTAKPHRHVWPIDLVAFRKRLRAVSDGQPTHAPAPAHTFAPSHLNLGTLALSTNSSSHASSSGASSEHHRHSRRVADTSPSPTPLPVAVTGIQRWWTYVERPIPGVGKAAANLSNGNYLIMADDVDIPEGGIDLAFRRVFNSLSGHNANNDDGSIPGEEGDRWTSNLDAHLGYIQTGSNTATISVYDGDGTRYDYACTLSTGSCTSQTIGDYNLFGPSGIEPVGTPPCAWQWTKKSGTSYIFNAPYSGCGYGAGNYGRLVTIYARNQQFYIGLNYAWTNSDDSDPENLTTITATHYPDQTSLVLNYQQPIGVPHTELTSITLPLNKQGVSNGTIDYHYSANGSLTAVDKPGNNPALPPGVNAFPTAYGDQSGVGIPTGNLPELYQDESNGLVLEVCGPRAALGILAEKTLTPAQETSTLEDGACVDFDHNASGVLTDWYTHGVLNFIPPDGTNKALQPAGAIPTNFYQWPDTTFIDVGSLPPKNGSVMGTQVSDGDGHFATYWYNYYGGVTEIDRDANNSDTLTRYQAWDSNNNLISYTDDRNDTTTNVGYDSNGNAVEVLQPNPQDGAGAPLSTYSYDAYNNVLAYCDPASNVNKAWTNNPGDSLCTSGGTSYGYSYSDPNELYGCLTHSTTPMGYTRKFTYDANGSTCGVGLPLTVQGDTITQAFTPAVTDTTRTPTQTFTYNADGTLHTYDAGNGPWLLGYDTMHRLATRADSETYQGQSYTFTWYTCYNNDGSVAYTETPAQHAKDATSCTEGTVQQPPYANVFGYDADGDEVSETHHYGQTATGSESLPAGTTLKWYDGLDRLVEVAQPTDQYHDYFSFAWMTRYIYDLNASGNGPDTVTIGSANQDANGGSLYAYGNLYKTQECVPSTSVTVPASGVVAGGGGNGSCSWKDVRGTTFDGLDRVISQFELSRGTSPTTTNTWDINGQTGYLAKITNGAQQVTAMTYDTDGRLWQKSFSDAPNTDRTYSYDADGHELSVSSPQWGSEVKTYNPDGLLSTVTEPSPVPSVWPDSGTTSYVYYGDDLLKTQSIVIQRATGKINLPNVLVYAYRPDGLLEQQNVNDNSGLNLFLGGSYAWTYDNAGRELTQSDPSTNQHFTATWSANGAGAVPYTMQYGPKTTQYDVNGNIQQLTLPTGMIFQTFHYDEEDEPLSYEIVPQPSGSAYYGPVHLNIANSYTIRGEFAGATQVKLARPSLWDTAAPSPCETAATGCSLTGGGNCTTNLACSGFNIYINGINLGNPLNGNATYDLRSGEIQGQTAQDCATAPRITCQGYTDTRTINYDPAGRQTVATGLGCKYVYIDANTNLPVTVPAGSVETRTYDAENHTTGRTVAIATTDPENGGPDVYACPHESTQDPTGYALAWGLDGHPWTDTDQAGTNGTTYMHWDDDSILFANYDSPNDSDTLSLYIGKLGVVNITPGQPEAVILTYDRDWGGQVVQTHDDLSFSSLTPSAGTPPPTVAPHGRVRINCARFPDSQGCLVAGASPLPSPTPPAGVTSWESSYVPQDMQRDDGYQIEDLTIQGVRAYDPIIAQWTTPDAYKGDVHDPMSQKPYMWNNNNPVMYSDPSGYCIEDACVGEAAAGAAIVEGGALGVEAIAEAAGDEALASSARSVAAGTRAAATAIGSRVTGAVEGAAVAVGSKAQSAVSRVVNAIEDFVGPGATASKPATHKASDIVITGKPDQNGEFNQIRVDMSNTSRPHINIERFGPGRTTGRFKHIFNEHAYVMKRK